jgi:YidC/Oxa1 family membrane protein insertase
MEILSSIFNTILYRPILNALVLLYETLPGQDFGVAIVVLTVIVRLLLYPSTLKSVKSQKALQELQPKIKEIQKKYKDNKQKQGEEVMKLYKEEKISPFSGCLPVLFQLPILIALFLVLKALAGNSGGIDQGLFYSFIPFSGEINTMFLGVLNLANPSPILAVVAGGTQFIQSKMMTSKNISSNKENKNDFSEIMQKQMLYFFPIVTFFILWKLPSAIALYWIVTALFSVGQQYLAFKEK